jgi:hypothetical protein
MVGHDRANGLAGCKKEVGHINFILIIVLRNGFAILVNQTKIGYFMVFFLILNGAVNQFSIDHDRLKNGQGLIYI